MECFVIIVNDLAVNYYHKALHLGCCSSPRSASDIFKSIFRRVLDKHAPLKIKKLRGNQAKFMTKEHGKAIMDQSRLKNKYLKWPSRENLFGL